MENTETKSQLVCAILDIGEMLLTAGAEVNRVEDTLRRIASAYGFQRTDVFTITSSIVVTMTSPEKEIITQTRRITHYHTDMQKIELLNSLSREICRQPLSLHALNQRIKHIQAAPVCDERKEIFFYGLIAAAFTLFFGGSLQDALASLFCAFVLKLTLKFGQKIGIQYLILTALSSFIMSAWALFLTRINFAQNFDMIVIGNIMLLIPGVSFTISLRDMIFGDTISGLLGLAEALLKALAIAIGFALVLFLWRNAL